MQERRRSDWLKDEKDISKCKACLGPSSSKFQSLTDTGLVHRTLVWNQKILNNLYSGNNEHDIDSIFNKWLKKGFQTDASQSQSDFKVSVWNLV